MYHISNENGCIHCELTLNVKTCECCVVSFTGIKSAIHEPRQNSSRIIAFNFAQNILGGYEFVSSLLNYMNYIDVRPSLGGQLWIEKLVVPIVEHSLPLESSYYRNPTLNAWRFEFVILFSAGGSNCSKQNEEEDT